MIPIVSEILKIGEKFIPDKNAQLEFEKEIQKLDLERAKINQKLFERIIPITFPLCVWTGIAYCCWWLFLSMAAFFKEGRYIFFEVTIPSFLMMTCGVFVTGLFGKKNIEGFFEGKNRGKKDE